VVAKAKGFSRFLVFPPKANSFPLADLPAQLAARRTVIVAIKHKVTKGGVK
jgi:hypothetical protein